MDRRKLKHEQLNVSRWWLKIINIIIAIAIGCFIVSLFLGIKEIINLNFDPSKQGMDYFINMFDTSIKIGAAIIAVLTIKVYFSNNNQTEKIIDQTERQSTKYIESENLKNFFLHRTEFRSYIQELDFFKKLSQLESFSFYSTWDMLYKTFYDGNYKEFEPKIKKDAKNSIANFINSIKNSSLNTARVSVFEKTELESIVEKMLPSIKDLIEEIVKLKIEQYNNSGLTNIEEIQLVLKITITIQLYYSILSFEGEPIPHVNTFNENTTNFLNKS